LSFFFQNAKKEFQAKNPEIPKNQSTDIVAFLSIPYASYFTKS